MNVKSSCPAVVLTMASMQEQEQNFREGFVQIRKVDENFSLAIILTANNFSQPIRIYNFLHFTFVNQFSNLVVYDLIALTGEFATFLPVQFMFQIDVQLVSDKVWAYTCRIFRGSC